MSYNIVVNNIQALKSVSSAAPKARREEEGAYGYRITQQVRGAIDISESTLYPVLRRLQKDDCLEVYDKAIDGRNRRYYRLTEQGRLQLQLYRREWVVYSQKISRIMKEGEH